ncbi:glycosyltransferase family 4 protein [uncultured Pontibacter sp.]|uniref:glycosyltransferase family 4 protein n=1 Tax=uncultured Pontibacter sp. TaxID=453356 RepID=UPI0026327EB2|nr:glycosyltransferase family 4 protein [uncultured Pontibacter sp.]
MKILYYSSHPNLNLASPSGYGTHMREMIAAFRELGHEVKPVIMGGTSLINSDLAIKGRSPLKHLIATCVPNYVWESAKDYRLGRFDNYASGVLEKNIKDFQPDLIYERATYLQTSGVRAANKWRVKHVLEVNSPYVEERKVLQGNSYFTEAGIRAEKLQLESTDKVVVVSSELKEHFMLAHKLDADKFIITPNAIDPAKINFDASRVEALRAGLQLAQKTVIGFVGSIFPWHGVDILIDAFGKVINSGKRDSHLLIVGDGEILPTLKEKTLKAGLLDKVTFTGNIPHAEVFNYIQLMDICVMGKSNWYGSPVKIFEYGAMGKAIIAPDNVPVKDVCKHEENAILIQPTSENIYTAIDLLISSQQLRNKISNNFKKQVLSQHTWLQNAEKVIAAIT